MLENPKPNNENHSYVRPTGKFWQNAHCAIDQNL